MQCQPFWSFYQSVSTVPNGRCNYRVWLHSMTLSIQRIWIHVDEEGRGERLLNKGKQKLDPELIEKYHDGFQCSFDLFCLDQNNVWLQNNIFIHLHLHLTLNWIKPKLRWRQPWMRMSHVEKSSPWWAFAIQVGMKSVSLAENAFFPSATSKLDSGGS